MVCYISVSILVNVIISKIRVLLPQAKGALADFFYPIYAILFGFIAPKTLNYLAFQSFAIERAVLMMVVPETCRAH